MGLPISFFILSMLLPMGLIVPFLGLKNFFPVLYPVRSAFLSHSVGLDGSPGIAVDRRSLGPDGFPGIVSWPPEFFPGSFPCTGLVGQRSEPVAELVLP